MIQIGSAPRTSSAECCFKNRVDAQIRTVSTVSAASLPGLRKPSVWAAAVRAAMAPMTCSEGKTLVGVSTA